MERSEEPVRDDHIVEAGSSEITGDFLIVVVLSGMIHAIKNK